jgi:hypothetical protein
MHRAEGVIEVVKRYVAILATDGDHKRFKLTAAGASNGEGSHSSD